MAYLHKSGYMMVGRHTKEHLVIVGNVLGKKIPDGVEIHHVNLVRHDNRNVNLVVCEDKTYHRLLHRRTHALKESGNPNWLKCTYCKKHDDPINISITNKKRGYRLYHKACHANYEYNRKRRNKL